MRTGRFESNGIKIPEAPVKALTAESVAGVEWDQWLKSGETIVTSEWSVAPEGLVISNDSYDETLGMTWAKISGGEVGVKYLLTNTVVTSGTDVMPSSTEPRSMYVRVVPNK